MKGEERWILCPVCGAKTLLRQDTLLRKFPLFCPKCKQESIIDAKNYHVSLAEAKKKVCSGAEIIL